MEDLFTSADDSVQTCLTVHDQTISGRGQQEHFSLVAERRFDNCDKIDTEPRNEGRKEYSKRKKKSCFNRNVHIEL